MITYTKLDVMAIITNLIILIYGIFLSIWGKTIEQYYCR